MKRIMLIALGSAMLLSTATAQITSGPSFKTREWKNIARKSSEEFYHTPKAKEIAETVLLYQRQTGGWPKNIPMHKPLTEEEKAKVLKDKTKTDDSTTDNDATILEMNYMANMYNHTGEEKYRESFLKAVEFLFAGQYENGGWPQFWPNPRGYQVHITFNDNSMIQIMETMKCLYSKKAPYDMIVTDQIAAKAKIAFDKGIECFMSTQYKKDGKLTIWGQQHDRETMLPAKARSYELPSLTPQESTSILKMLMSVNNPSPEIKNSIVSAMQWLEDNQIKGKRVEYFINEDDLKDRRLIDDADAEPLWSRYYDLETGKPYVCDRDGIKKESMDQIGYERRNGYKWYSDDPSALMGRYEAWKKKNLK